MQRSPRLSWGRGGVWFGRCYLSSGAVFALALVWTLASTRLLLMLLLAAVLHECGHLAACAVYRIPVQAFCLTACGAEFRLGRVMRPSQRFVTALAGPAVNLLLALGLTVLLPGQEDAALLAGANLIAGLFNLLPVEPLDGGYMLTAGCEWLGLGEEVTQALNQVITALLILSLFPCVLLALKGNCSLLLLVLWLLVGQYRAVRS